MKIKTYCINCEINGKNKRKEGIIPVTDDITGFTVYMCKRCFKEWKELQLIVKEYGNNFNKD